MVGMSGGAWEIGVDIGGTFTDVVCRRPGGPLHVMKVPTSRADPSVSVLASLEELRNSHDVSLNDLSRFAHGTTVATNAVLERKGAKIGLITTQGFRDVLEIGRQSRRQMYDVVLRPQTPVFLAPGRVRKEVSERVSATGDVVMPLDEAGLRRVVDELVEDGVEAIAIVFLFSFANPVHERRAKDLILQSHPDLMVSASHEVDPAFREYERTVATAFDAYLKPAVDRYLARLEDGLARSGAPVPLQVMQSRGGLTSAAVARGRPVRLFLSGPAAGVVGGRIAGASAGDGDLITIDVGGTSADIALISRRKPLIRSEGDVGGFVVRTPMVDVNTIGSGGGSIARIDAAGGLKVGPQSARSEPGPACYGRGGRQATVCDASVVLGYLDPDYFAGGTLKLNAQLAFDVIEQTVARPLGLSVQAAALGIHRVLERTDGRRHPAGIGAPGHRSADILACPARRRGWTSRYCARQRTRHDAHCGATIAGCPSRRGIARRADRTRGFGRIRVANRRARSRCIPKCDPRYRCAGHRADEERTRRGR